MSADFDEKRDRSFVVYHTWPNLVIARARAQAMLRMRLNIPQG